DLSAIAATPSAPAASSEPTEEPPRVQRDVDVEVNGKRFNVRLWVPDVAPVVASGNAGAQRAARPRPGRGGGGHGGAAGSGTVTVPMQGTIVKVLVNVGDQVEIGQAICVLEAMKMENHINAEKAGTITEIK